MVLRHGGDVNARNANGSAFHVALARDNQRVVDFLLTHLPGLDLLAEDAQGRTVFDLLEDPLHLNTAVRLLDALRAQQTAEENRRWFRKSRGGNTVLHRCVLSGNAALLKYLLSHKAQFGICEEAANDSGKDYHCLEVG